MSKIVHPSELNDFNERPLTLNIELNELRQIIDDLTERLVEKPYTQYLNDKTVVIVGPARTIEGKGEGSFIDSFDVTVRFNTTFYFIPFSPEQTRDIGSRTDVLYLAPSSMIEFAVDQDKDRSAECIVKGGIQYILYQNKHKAKLYNHGPYMLQKELEKFQFEMGKRNVLCEYYYVNESMNVMSTILAERSGTSIVARTGALSIFDCLVHGASKIAVKGMTFYCGGGHMFRETRGELHPLHEHHNLASPHNSILELDLMKKLLTLYEDRFIIDDVLASLLDS